MKIFTKRVANILGLVCVFVGMANGFAPTSFNLDCDFLEQFVKLEKAGDISLTHEEILTRGLIQSVASHFKEKGSLPPSSNPSPTSLKSLYESVYQDADVRPVGVESVLKILLLNVAIVDLDPRTKSLPYAHFDGETMYESNKRVVTMKQRILRLVRDHKDYRQAAEQIGQVFHTIHDFYSHSNWVELGHKDFNKDIGNEDAMNSFLRANKTRDVKSCQFENCTKKEIKCSRPWALVLPLIQLVFGSFLSDTVSNFLTCPMVYFECTDNIVTKDHLISGFASGQRLPDGTAYEKPSNGLKCSHGGLIDSTATQIDPLGGINKDTAYYAFSPAAHLHQKAAALAIDNTEFIFDEFRRELGSDEFVNLLQLDRVERGRIGFWQKHFSFLF
jgi:hypothetical protein